MEEIKVILSNGNNIIVCGFSGIQEFTEYINKENQFIKLVVRRYYCSENYFRDDDGYSNEKEQIVLNKNLIQEFYTY